MRTEAEQLTLYSVWEDDFLVVATTSNFDAHNIRLSDPRALVVHEQTILVERPTV